MPKQRTTILALLLAGFPACERTGPTDTPMVVDSAGVQIITSSRPTWREEDRWLIAAEPTLRVGAVDGDTLYQFNLLIDAVRLTDGRVATADATTRIRFFGPDGQFLSSVGGPGRGPGEFVTLSQLSRLPGDTLLAYDSRLNRISFFDSVGRLLRTVDLKHTSTAPIGAVYYVDGGDFVTQPTWQLKMPIESGLQREPAPVLRYSQTGELLDTIGMFPGTEVVIEAEGGRVGFTIPPFQHRLGMAVLGDRLIVGTANSFELNEFNPMGALRRSIRRPGVDLEITAEALAAYRNANLNQARDPAERDFLVRLFEQVPIPATKPAFSRILTDPTGNVWLSPFESNAYSETLWNVFSADGTLLGEVEVPDGLRILEIGDDYVLGRWRDDVQVEYLQLHRLVKK